MRIIAVLFILVSIASCKRYEEGPLVSFRSPEGRLTNSWTYNLVLRNGLNISRGEGSQSTNYLTSSIGFDQSGRFSQIDKTDSAELEYDGLWTFEEKKQFIKLDYLTDGIESRRLEIHFLKKDEFWFSEVVNNVVFEYHLVSNSGL